MKKVICFLLIFHFGKLCLAQDSLDKTWHAEAGPMITVPIRYLHYYSVLGLGADVAANRQFVKGLFAGARMNYAFFFGNLFVKPFPEVIHYRNPLALAIGDFIKLVFEFGGKVVIHILCEMFGEKLIDDVAGVGGDKAFLF